MGTAEKDVKHPDSLFGPNIGVVSSGPAWTNVNEKKMLRDELTQDIVRGWIEKSKEASEPTTTLQALVNLKRPTLRLSPLTEDSSDSDHQHHGLEFEYDCDAPKCGIYVHVLLPSDHPDAPTTASANGFAKLLVFETVVEGGFGKILKLEEGATLELGRFEDEPTTPIPSASSSPDPSATPADTPSPVLTGPTPEPSRQTRRRFTHLHFRKRTHNHSVSGPALAVVDAEPSTVHTDKEIKKEDEGVRVTIRLAALDEQGTELASPNEQVTYLHVVRFGAKPTSAPEEPADDTRPWVVKVVKREATIGPHTFHLHEIYGLSSSSSATHAPTAPLPNSHTYPPESGQQTAVTDDEPSSECLLCLSSPREVVLLPCRHLVACKECALNMVEFGAGGQITQAEEPVAVEEPAPTEGQNETETNNAAPPGETPQAASTTSVTPAPAPTRRKRKAKGWFCPVCRQPYTSLLRITTTPPEETKDEEHEEDVTDVPATAAATAERSGGGILSGGFRPTFLRFSPRNQQTDVEAQRAVPAAA
ncbi:hypothetical protein BDZ89DRAFT_957832 [Hymenopellis radicata]|nr:hypothetical protein BDZ89DRAFT_957832 [Hymenopellis radicata]